MNSTPRPNAADFDDFDDYVDALSRLEWLTPAEYACVLSQSIADGEESYSERLTQYRSECAMFGDAGPGQFLTLRSNAEQVAEDRAKLARVRRIIANLSNDEAARRAA